MERNGKKGVKENVVGGRGDEKIVKGKKNKII